jgi:hypothetical protein
MPDAAEKRPDGWLPVSQARDRVLAVLEDELRADMLKELAARSTDERDERVYRTGRIAALGFAIEQVKGLL